MAILFGIFAILALIVLPWGYTSLYRAMSKAGTSRLVKATFFFSFGTFGGICLMGCLGIPLGIFCYPFVLLASLLACGSAIRLGISEPIPYRMAAINTACVASLPFVLLIAMLVYGLTIHSR
jgi:hypothetical protein